MGRRKITDIDDTDILRNQSGQERYIAGFYLSFYKVVRRMSNKKRLELQDAILQIMFTNRTDFEFNFESNKDYFELIKPVLLSEVGKFLGRKQRRKGIVNNPNGNNQYTDYQEDNPDKEDETEDKTMEDERIKRGQQNIIIENRIKNKENKKLSNESKKVPTGGTLSPSKNRTFVVPSLAEVKAYATSLGATEEQAEFYYDTKTANGWTLGNGRSLKDWQADFRVWKRKGYFADNVKTSTGTNAPTATVKPKFVD